MTGVPEQARSVSLDLALEGTSPLADLPVTPHPLASALAAAGTEPWLDTGDRAAASSAWDPEVRALTTNNTLVNQVIQSGALDEVIAGASKRLRAAAPGIDDGVLVREIGFVANARVALDLVRTFGVKVSVELHPAIAEDVSATVAWGRRYYSVCPEDFIVKVPMTPAGLLAVRKLSAEGVPVNFTLGFSARQNVLAALFARPLWVNVFLGRLNAVIKDNQVGSGTNIGERACLASDAAIKALRQEPGGPPTRQIAASIRDGAQVGTLAGVDVHTAPPKAFLQYLDSHLDPADVRPYGGTDLEVDTDLDCSVLWSVTPELEVLARAAAEPATRVRGPGDLVELARAHDVGDLFRDWTADERAEIRADGKIPILEKWLPRTALDDLMTRAALESFTADQAALDDRIRGLMC